MYTIVYMSALAFHEKVFSMIEVLLIGMNTN